MDRSFHLENATYNENIFFLSDEWKSICSKIEHGDMGVEIINLRIILSDIINEYELNKFQNRKQKKVYIKLIEKVLSEKIGYIVKYREELLMLKGKIEQDENEYAYVIAKNLAKQIEKESSAEELFNELRVMVTETTTDKMKRAKIRTICKSIIIELVTSGRHVKDITKYVDGVLGGYIKSASRVIPLFDDIPEGIDDIAKFIDELTIDDRLNSLRKKLISTKQQYTLIFPIWGGSIVPDRNKEIDAFYGVLYDPLMKKEFEEEEDLDERFPVIPNNNESITDASKREKESRCNVKIQIAADSPTEACELAENKVVRILNLLNTEFGVDHRNFFWDGQYICMSQSTRHCSFCTGPFGGYGDTAERIDRMYPFEIDDNKKQKIKKITDVLYWLEENSLIHELNTLERTYALLAKSEGQSHDDKLVNCWIALENLASIAKNENENNFDFLAKAIPNIYFLWSRYEPIQHLFRLSATYATSSYKKDSTIDFPEEFIQSMHFFDCFSEGKQVSLLPFYSRMNELKNYTTKASYLDEIEDVVSFYSDNEAAAERMKKKKEDIELTLAYIYKCRNQIVHNGYIDSKLVPSLREYARGFALSLKNRILEVYHEKKQDLGKHFLEEDYQAKLLEKKLKSKREFIDLMLDGRDVV